MQIVMALSFETVNPSKAFSADLNCSYQEVLKSAPSDACSSFCKEMHSTIRNLHGATNQAVAQGDLFCKNLCFWTMMSSGNRLENLHQ